MKYKVISRYRDIINDKSIKSIFTVCHKTKLTVTH